MLQPRIPRGPGEESAIAAKRKPLALIVDDAPDTRTILRALATQRGFEVIEAEDGALALEAARSQRPDLILLDIRMPNMNGLEALEEIREEDPNVSVVIISGESDEATLEEALSLGATNFVHKPFDPEEVRFVLDRSFQTIEEEQDIQAVVKLVTRRATRIDLPSETLMLGKVVSYLGRELTHNFVGYTVQLTDIKLALYEALANALEHGNLEITFDEKTQAMETKGGILGLIQTRIEAGLGERQIQISVEYDQASVTYRIEDQGPGFDPATMINKPVADTSALHGRGITLIRHYMDEVSWNESGNEITLVKHFGERIAEDGTS